MAMNCFRKVLLVGLAAAMIFSQMPAPAAAQSRAPAAEKITENEPEIASTEEVSFGAPKPNVSKGVWTVMGVTLLTGLVVLGLAGAGGGGDDDNGGDPRPSSGDVSFEW